MLPNLAHYGRSSNECEGKLSVLTRKNGERNKINSISEEIQNNII